MTLPVDILNCVPDKEAFWSAWQWIQLALSGLTDDRLIYVEDAGVQLQRSAQDQTKYHRVRMLHIFARDEDEPGTTVGAYRRVLIEEIARALNAKTSEEPKS